VMMMRRRRRRRRSLLNAASDQTSLLQKPTSPNVYYCPTCAALLCALCEAEPTFVPVLSASLISKGTFVPVFLTLFFLGGFWMEPPLVWS
jgi:hypothetical protein